MDAPFRRVITGHSPSGKAVIAHDDTLKPVHYRKPDEAPTGKAFGLTLLFRTEGSSEAAISNNVPFNDPYKTSIPIAEPGHTNWRIIDFPPHSSAPMHRTTSVDFGVVLKGEVVLEVDDGVETVLKEQTGVVQRGTIHAWHNRTDEVSRMLFVVLPSDEVKVNGEVLGDVDV